MEMSFILGMVSLVPMQKCNWSPKQEPSKPRIAIPSDANYIQIDQDGTISAIYNSSPDPVVVGTIQVADFINPAFER